MDVDRIRPISPLSRPLVTALAQSVKRPLAAWLAVTFATAMALTPHALAAPQAANGANTGDGTTPMTGLAQAPEANLFVGSAVASIPIEVPPGRKNLTPTLALAYNSGAAAISPYGYGWDLPIGRVQRNLKDGVLPCDPNSPAMREFVLSLPGSSLECTKSTSGDNDGKCVPWVEQSFGLLQYIKSGNYWKATDKSGTQYFFGEETSARLGSNIGRMNPVSSADCGSTYAWGLTHIQDTNGNLVTVSYVSGASALYPAKIRYGGNIGASSDYKNPAFGHLYSVELNWPVNRGDPGWLHAGWTNSIGGFESIVDRLLPSIDVRWIGTSSNQLIRRYQLSYDPPADVPGIHRLVGVQLVGQNGQTLQNHAHADVVTAFDYKQNQSANDPNKPNEEARFGFGVSQEVSRPPSHTEFHNAKGSVRLDVTGTAYTGTFQDVMDMNGDGFPDLVSAANECQEYWEVYWGSESGFSSTASDWDYGKDLSCIGEAFHSVSIRETSRDEQNFHLDGCDSLESADAWCTTIDTFDIDGDGYVDRIEANPETPHGTDWLVYYGTPPATANDKWGFKLRTEPGGATHYWRAPLKFLQRTQRGKGAFGWSGGGSSQPESTITDVDLIDMNGDGRVDMVEADGTNWNVWINTGDGFSATAVSFDAQYPYIAFVENNSKQILGTFDINGDSLPDQVMAWDKSIDNCTSNCVYPGYWQVFLNGGHGVGGEERWTLPAVWSGTSARFHIRKDETTVTRDFFDINGDGLPDLVDTTGWSNSSKKWQVFLNRGTGFAPVEYWSGAPMAAIRAIEREGDNLLFALTTQNTFDIDGDGLPDFIDMNVMSGTNFTTKARIHHSISGAWCAKCSGESSNVCSTTSNCPGIIENPSGARTNLMVAMRNGVGSTTFLDYRPTTKSNATHYRVDDPLKIPALPFAIWTVTGITTTDGMCDESGCLDSSWEPARHQMSTRISYEFGRYDPIGREFRGFGRVRQTDPEGNITETNFHQDWARKGRPFLVSKFAADPNNPTSTSTTLSRALSESFTAWNCVARGSGSSIYCADIRPDPPPAEASRPWVRQEGSQSDVFSNYTRDFNNSLYRLSLNVAWASCPGVGFTGQVAQTAEAGRAAPRVDTYTDYACASGPYIFDKPKSVRTVKYLGSTLLEQKYFFYDTPPSDTPTKGNVTRVESRLEPIPAIGALQASACTTGGGRCVVTSMAYNAYGLITDTINANNVTTTNTYDVTQIYPSVTISDSAPGGKRHKVRQVYDPYCGKKIEETIAVTEFTPATPASRWSYDSFCRLERVALPGDDLNADPNQSSSNPHPPHQVISYELGSKKRPTVIKILSREPNYCGVSETIPSVSCSGSNKGFVATWALVDALGRPLQQHSQRVIDGAFTTVASSSTVYDRRGNPVIQYVPFQGGITGGTYQPPSGVATTLLQYDALSRVTRKTDPDGRYTDVDQITTANVRTTKDKCWSPGPTCPAGKLVETIDGAGRVLLKQAYDGSTLESSTQYTYDAAGRLTDTVQWDGASFNQKTKITIQYDSLGRKILMKDPDTGTSAPGEWRYGYDAMGNIRFQDSPQGNRTHFCYDSLNRLTYKYAGAGATTSLTACGSAGARASLSYDHSMGGFGIGRLTSVSDESGTSFFRYDARGRITSQSRKLAYDTDSATSVEWANFAFDYDDADHVIGITYPDSEIVTHAYDLSGQLVRLQSNLTESSGATVKYLTDAKYDIFGRPLAMVHGNGPSGNGVKDTLSYYGATQAFRLSEIKSVRTASPAATYIDRDYTGYTAKGQITTIDDQLANPGDLIDDYLFTYDGLNRLTGATRNSGTTEVYDHDPLGNLSVWKGISLAGKYDPNHPHQLTKVPATGASIGYDANGNRSSKSSLTYTYNQEDRLVGIGSDVGLIYDYGGQRALEFDYTGCVSTTGAPCRVNRYFGQLAESSEWTLNGTTTLTKHYFAGAMRIASRTNANWAAYASVRWDDPPAIMLARTHRDHLTIALRDDVASWTGSFLFGGVLVLMLWPSQTRRSAGVALRRGPTIVVLLVWVVGTQPFAWILLPLAPRAAWAAGMANEPPPISTSDSVIHYHSDHLGSPLALTDSAGWRVQQIRYDAYGHVRGRWDGSGGGGSLAAQSRYEFTGYQTEEHSGLAYAGARFYDPDLGTFLTHDPAREFANPYTYTDGNPVNRVDPSGQFIEELIIAAVLAFSVSFLATTAQANAKGASLGQSLKAGAISGAIGAAMAVGFSIVGAAASAIGPAAEVAFNATSIGLGAYGAAQSFSEGQIGMGILSAAMLAYSFYNLSGELSMIAEGSRASGGGLLDSIDAWWSGRDATPEEAARIQKWSIDRIENDELRELQTAKLKANRIKVYDRRFGSAYGLSFSDGTVYLPTDSLELATKTLGHEQFHVLSYLKGGPQSEVYADFYGHELAFDPVFARENPDSFYQRVISGEFDNHRQMQWIRENQ